LNTRRDLLALAALCALTYFFGLTTHGLTNWQEAQRALVARDMHARGEWLVPTINGRPYLAKPPMFYWTQLAIAKLRGGEPAEFDLRLTVALAGLAGVIATYFVARRLFRHGESPTIRSPDVDESSSRAAALWSALFLATGILYVRSSRIGELDILLVPFVVIAVGGIAAAWRSHLERRRAALVPLVIATLAATGAVMTKGPPGFAVIAFAGYGGIALHYAFEPEPASRAKGGAPAIGVALIGIAGAAVAIWRSPRIADVPGALLMGLLCAALAAAFLRLVEPGRLTACLRAYARTHPIAVLGIPLLFLWLWGRALAARIGADAAMALAAEEAGDNLRLFAAAAPLKNIEALSYGVGLGSLAAIGAVAWLAWARPRLRPQWFILLAWVGLGLAIFSLAGKGVARYLTPLWPGVAMLGGFFIATRLRDSRNPGLQRLALAAGVILLGVVQGWWYAGGREQFYPERSPRAFMGELLSQSIEVDPAHLATFEFRHPAIDYYARHPVQPIGDIGMREGMAGITPWTLADLRQHLEEQRGAMTILLRAGSAGRLLEAGFMLSPITLRSRFTIDSGRSEVGAWRVAAPAESR
jgi:4-amino-4-deoxy-L-arabinose transferase-like glycosyltransferase